MVPGILQELFSNQKVLPLGSEVTTNMHNLLRIAYNSQQNISFDFSLPHAHYRGRYNQMAGDSNNNCQSVYIFSPSSVSIWSRLNIRRWYSPMISRICPNTEAAVWRSFCRVSFPMMRNWSMSWKKPGTADPSIWRSSSAMHLFAILAGPFSVSCSGFRRASFISGMSFRFEKGDWSSLQQALGNLPL